MDPQKSKEWASNPIEEWGTGQFTAKQSERILYSAHDLAKLLPTKGIEQIDIAKFYLLNSSSRPTAAATVQLKVSDNLILEYTRGEKSTPGRWNLSWGFEGNFLLFAPLFQEKGEILGKNTNWIGRYNQGFPDYALTIRSHGDGYTIIGPDNNLYPALTVQFPEVKELKITNQTEENLPHPDPSLPLASFGTRLSLENSFEDRIYIDRQIIVYPEFVLMAEREMHSGPLTDCPAHHWDDRLIQVKGPITSSLLEEGYPEFKITSVSHYTYPDGLLKLVGSQTEGFYDLINRIISKNSQKTA